MRFPGGMGKSAKNDRSRFWLPTLIATGVSALLATAGCAVAFGQGIGGSATGAPVPVCSVSAELVNSCRAWLGGAAAGNPGAAKDPTAQFEHLESLVGQPMDVFRDYDNCSATRCTTGTIPLAAGSPEQYFATHGKYVDVNWKPATNFSDADGGNAAVNAEITTAARNIRAIAPRQVFLTVWHEPQNDVTSGTSTCGHLKGTAGSPQQYVAMWHNVASIFAHEGVTNVVWNMDYMGSAGQFGQWNCLVPQLWPGNDLVDWVTWDTYSRGKTWDQTSGAFYRLLENDNSTSTDFEAKAWGIGEFGTCKQPTTGITAAQYYDSVTSAITAGTYPRLKMYLVFADTGNNSGPGCLTDYDDSGRPDPAKQAAFNRLAGTVLRGRG